MAKKIGTDKKFIKTITCKNCASIIEYTLQEIKEVNGRDYSGGADGCRYIDCPECSKRILLEVW